MPYWNKGEKQVDMNGVEINHGDILHMPQATTLDPPYYVCFEENGGFSVRDLLHNNVCICTLGIKEGGGDVINLGHWTKNSKYLDAYDIAYYFFNSQNPSAVSDAEKLKEKLEKTEGK